MAIRLGELIRRLEGEPQDNSVRFDFGGFIPRRIDSYRGFYDQLAISYDDDWRNKMKVSEFILVLREVVGKTLEGYKGGGYKMDERTPVWAANYGECNSTAVVGLAPCNWGTVLETRWED